MNKKIPWHHDLKIHLTVSSKMGILTGILFGLIDGFYILLFKGRNVAFAILYSMREPEIIVLLYGILVYGGLGLIVGSLLGIVGQLAFRIRRQIKQRAELVTFYSTFIVMFTTFIVIVGVISDNWLNNDILGYRGLFLMITLFVICVATFNQLRHLTTYCYKIIHSPRGSIIKRGLIAIIIAVSISISPSLYQLVFKSQRMRNESIINIHRKTIRKPNVILIVIDALRADHLSIYGYPRSTSPNIDKVAREGILFLKMFSQASWTKPSVATMLTSLYPTFHQLIYHDKFKLNILSDTLITLPEVLQKKGYYTVGLVTNPHLAPLYNFGQGFDEYRFLKPSSLYRLSIFKMLRFQFNIYFVSSFYKDAEELNDQAFEWLSRNKGKPFFMYLHYMEPHWPYFIHPNHNIILDLKRNVILGVENRKNGDINCLKQQINLYDGEITYVDKHIGNLMNFLKREKMYDNTLIILTSDHGEEFQEHGGWSHGRTLFNEVIKIPLIVKLPFSKGAGLVNINLVSTIDLAPFILKQIGIKVPDSMQGVPQLFDVHENLTWERYVLSEHGPMFENGVIIRSLTSYEWKMIKTIENNNGRTPKIVLFNLAKDPLEKRDLSLINTKIVDKFVRKLDYVLESTRKISFTQQTVKPDKANLEQLKSLGYVQ